MLEPGFMAWAHKEDFWCLVDGRCTDPAGKGGQLGQRGGVSRRGVGRSCGFLHKVGAAHGNLTWETAGAGRMEV